MKSAKQRKSENTNKHKPVRRGNDNYIIIALRSHKVALMTSLIRLLLTPFTTAMAVTSMAIAIVLAGSFYILASNAQHLVDSLQAGKQMSLFLHEQVYDQQASKLAEELRDIEVIEKIVLISKEQALTEFKLYSGFGAALDALQSNPLPIVIQVVPKDSLEAYQLSQLSEQMQQLQGVDFVQIDMEWVARLQAIMQIARRVGGLLSGLLALAVVFVTGNTIRSELQARQDEVVVTKLVGGTNTFICVPFLYAGFWYGFISGVLAWSIIVMMLMMVREPIEHLSLLYQSQFQLHFMNFYESILLVFASSMLGVIGALVVVSQQLRLLKPE